MKSINPCHRLFGLFLLCCLSGTALALQSDSEQPFNLEADGVEINDATGVSIYQGNVIITQGTIRITADQVTVTQSPGQGDHIVAEGKPVRFQQRVEGKKQLVKGHSKKAIYDTDSEILTMIGDAVMTQGKDSFKSDRIIYDRVKGQVRAGSKAKGKQRVRVTIQPKKKRKPKTRRKDGK